jgi:ABC-type Fe3+-siderophore transport system permease subunit
MDSSREEARRAAGERRLRRLIGSVVFGGILVVGVWILPRFLPRSPLTIVAACVLAVVAMKLVERRLYQWLRRFRGQDVSGARRPGA